MFKYIKEAERFYEEAIKELEKAKEAKDEVRGRDACDKAWLSVIKATEALFIKRGVKEEELPKGYRSQRYLLSKYAGKDLRGTFHISRDIFHIAGYYEGMIDFDILPEYLEDVKEYIEKIKDLAREKE